MMLQPWKKNQNKKLSNATVIVCMFHNNEEHKNNVHTDDTIA
jgi:hypothetical protein